jgi:hypothetical protein
MDQFRGALIKPLPNMPTVPTARYCHDMARRRMIMLSIADRVRFTKNVKRRRQQFLNNELRTVVGIDDSKIIFDKGELVRNGVALHVDQVIVNVLVRAFSQAKRESFA